MITQTNYIGITLILGLLLLYAILGAFIERKKPIIGNEMSVIVVIATGISFLVWSISSVESNNLLTIY